MSLIIILCSYIFTRSSFRTIYGEFILRSGNIYIRRLAITQRNYAMYNLFISQHAKLIRISYTRPSRKERKGVRERRRNAPMLFRERVPSVPSLSLPLASLLFLPSFLSRYKNHTVYISSGYYMHILLSCIHFFTLLRISLLLFPTSSPSISRAYAILQGAHASLTPPPPLAHHHFLRPPPSISVPV